LHIAAHLVPEDSQGCTHQLLLIIIHVFEDGLLFGRELLGGWRTWVFEAHEDS
jgi:hypothetical protein